MDASKQTPALSIGSNLNGVQIEPLLKDLQGEAKLAGITQAKVNVKAVGNTESAVKKTLNGNASFAFKDGALVGVNIAKLIRDGMAKLNRKPVAKTNEPEKTDFSSLGGTAKITNGVINNNDFKMSSPLLRITGAGKADLVRRNRKTGWISMWEMDGNHKTYRGIGKPQPDVDIVGIGDLNGDGKADLVRRNAVTGWVSMWEMDGSHKTYRGIGRLKSGVEIVGVGDLSGEGKADILRFNPATGWVSMWEMDGHLKTYRGIGKLDTAEEMQPSRGL